MSISMQDSLDPDLNCSQSSNVVKQPLSPQDGNNPTEQTQKGLEDDAQTEPQQQESPNETNLTNSPKAMPLEDSKDKEIYEEKVKPDLMEFSTDSPNETFSATTKAFKRVIKNRIKRSRNNSGALKKKKLNNKLSKLLIPKSAVILLHELLPDCVFKVVNMPGCSSSSFCVEIKHNNVILGVGYGTSKSQAKNLAAENAIKTVVLNAISHQSSNATETDGNDEGCIKNLPWAGLASFAIFKMFNEWKVENTAFLSMARHISKQESKQEFGLSERKLPQNAAELHPCAVLNIMYPGLVAFEIERKDEPMYQIKMGYTVDGKMYTGVAGNKKEAKKEAAKAVLLSLHGLFFNE